MSSTTRKKSLIYLFNEVDSDGKGYFTCEQLRDYMQEEGHADEAFAQLDTDGDGRVTLEDFLCAHEKFLMCKDEMQYVLESDKSTTSTTSDDNNIVKFPSEIQHSSTMWRCFRDKLSQDCPELINDFDQLLQEVMNDYERQEASFERQKEENRDQLQQLGQLFDEQIIDTQQQLLNQATKITEQNELQNVLNHKQEEVLSLKEKVEVLEAQVRSRQESHDHLAANLQLAEEEKKQLQEQLQMAKLAHHHEESTIHHHCSDDKEDMLPLTTSESSPCISSESIVTPPNQSEESRTTLPQGSKESTTTPPQSSTDTMVTPPQSSMEIMTTPPYGSKENMSKSPKRGDTSSSSDKSSSPSLEEGELLDSMPGTPNHTFKILLLGDQSVGKTAILNRICNNSFNLQYRATIGVEFRSKYLILDNKIIAIKLWDTAGQERFKSITRSYIRGTNGLLMVYDITNRDSFDSVSEWIDSAMECADKSLLSIMLLGNKVDMAALRKVSHNAGKTVARQYKCGHYEVSAKTGDNVLLSLITMIKMMVAMETEQNIPRNVIHLHTNTPGSDHTHKCCMSHS